jgi:Ca-activated chloride channel family protein
MRRPTALLAMIAVPLAAMAQVLACAPATAAPTAAPNATDGVLAPVMLVLDGSGSMLTKDAGNGTSRIDAAKSAATAVIRGLPAGAKLGLEVYGTRTGSSAAEKTAGCRDVTVVAPPGGADAGTLASDVAAVKPSGYTPIGTALRTAADQLPKEGPRSVVLVSDGEDTCAPPPPCDVAAQLAKEGVDLRIHTVGFRVNQAAREQLQCIARVTGGSYADAPDAGRLAGALARITDLALRHYQPIGTPVTGTPTADNAPLLAPGQYLDAIGPREARHYALDLAEGVTGYVAATTVFPRGTPRSIETLKVEIHGVDGTYCLVFDQQLESLANAGSSVTASTSFQVPVGGPSSGAAVPAGCSRAGRYDVIITRDETVAGGTDRVPLEILTRAEPPLTGDQGPAADPAKVAFTPSAATAVPVHGGGSFAEAAPLSGAGRYSDTVHYGETAFYKVHLDWGQGLAYRARLGAIPGISSGTAGTIANVRTWLATPVRKQVQYETTAYTGHDEGLPVVADSLASSRVLYRNRFLQPRLPTNVSIDGWYYIAVGLIPPVTTDATPASGMPITLDVTVTGDTVPAPAYATVAGATTGDPVPSGTPGSTSGPAAAAPATRSVSHTAALLAFGGLGTVLVLGIAAGVLLLALRRRARR